MALPARDGQRLEVEQAVVGWIHGPVAGSAGGPFVPTFKAETAVPVVIEFFGQPIHRHVAAVAGDGCAVGGALVCELATVDILVANPAFTGRPAESHSGL